VADAAGARSFVVFEGAEDLFFSGKEVKTPTLPNTGRVGHPENLNRHQGAAVLSCHHPLGRFLQLKKLGRIGHPPIENRDSIFWWPALGAVYYARDFYRILGHAVNDKERERRHR
jgi:hypothetical protein